MPKLNDVSDKLKALMQPLGITSFRQLSDASGVSMKQIRKIRKGDLDSLRLGAVTRLAQALNRPVIDFAIAISILPEAPPTDPAQSVFLAQLSTPPLLPEFSTDPQAYTALKTEYHRLQQQQDQQIQDAILNHQTAALQTLESWLQSWPVAAHAAETNESFPATKLLPLCRPIQTLLDQWQVVAIATVGEEVSYDPQQHELMEATAALGDSVRIRYPGYIHQGKLLFRAKVSPISQSD